MVQNSTRLRALCFLLCIPSGGALLARVYGLISMPVGALAVALPCCLALTCIWWWARRAGRTLLADALMIGFVGGLLGTIAYDLARVPFYLAGQRVFAPISAYGIWIADADVSSRFTDTIGWTYHFSNGITFGVMYALFMRRRHWGWAMLWGLTLETIAIASPFAQIFRLSGNYPAIGIAYLGHLAYGWPLGLLVHHWDETRRLLASLPRSVIWPALIVAAALLLGPLASPDGAARDARARAGEFSVEGIELNPDWLRIGRDDQVEVFNHEDGPVTIVLPQLETTTLIERGARTTLAFPETGIYQVYVRSSRRSRSSFVIVEPVEDPD